jgi:hypothetical protein
LGRLRRQRPTVDLEAFEAQRTEAQIIKFPHTGTSDDPERTMRNGKFCGLSRERPTISPRYFGLYS